MATSSAEAELKAVCKGVSELIQCCHVAEFLCGERPSLSLGVDAGACRGILMRQGAGALKHLGVRQLWVQEAIVDYKVRVDKIGRDSNLADFLCSPGKEATLETRLTEFGCVCFGSPQAIDVLLAPSLQGVRS